MYSYVEPVCHSLAWRNAPIEDNKYVTIHIRLN